MRRCKYGFSLFKEVADFNLSRSIFPIPSPPLSRGNLGGKEIHWKIVLVCFIDLTQ